tara:strand:+ start:1327 stop:2970 length:1644 start_codon:yes stop_codon:yes gene_type:complete
MSIFDTREKRETNQSIDALSKLIQSIGYLSTYENSTEDSTGMSISDITKISNLNIKTNDAHSTLIDNITNDNDLNFAKEIVFNSDTYNSPISNSQIDAQNNINKIRNREIELEAFKGYMKKADSYLSQWDAGEISWENMTNEDLVNLKRFTSDFSSITTQYKTEGGEDKAFPIHNFMYTSNKSGRNQSQIINRIEELRDSEDAAIIALRSGNEIDDYEATLISLGDVEGLKDYNKYSAQTTYNNYKHTQSLIKTKTSLIDKFDLNVSTGQYRAMNDVEKNIYRTSQTAVLEAAKAEYLSTFQNLVRISEPGDEYYGLDATDINSQDFINYLESEKEEIQNLDPNQFVQRKRNEVKVLNQKLKFFENKYKRQTGIDVSGGGIDKSNLRKRIDEKLKQGSIGDTPENPITLNQFNVPDDSESTNKVFNNATVGYSPSSNKYFVLEEDVEKDVKEEVKPSDSIKDFTLRKPSSSKDFEKRVENFWINSSKDIKKEFGSLKKFKIYADDLLLKVFADKYEEVSKLTEKDLKIAESIGIKNLKNINLEDIRY